VELLLPSSDGILGSTVEALRSITIFHQYAASYFLPIAVLLILADFIIGCNPFLQELRP
jgi:hypothetical protein